MCTVKGRYARDLCVRPCVMFVSCVCVNCVCVVCVIGKQFFFFTLYDHIEQWHAIAMNTWLEPIYALNHDLRSHCIVVYMVT